MSHSLIYILTIYLCYKSDCLNLGICFVFELDCSFMNFVSNCVLFREMVFIELIDDGNEEKWRQEWKLLWLFYERWKKIHSTRSRKRSKCSAKEILSFQISSSSNACFRMGNILLESCELAENTICSAVLTILFYWFLNIYFSFRQNKKLIFYVDLFNSV